MRHVIWRTGPNRAFAAEVGGLRLLVEVPDDLGGSARFLVIRKEDGKHPNTLIGSGYTESVRTAMEAAERSANRSISSSLTQA
jgi:hypothetical protein